MFCRHCGTATVSRPRGLCWTCYYAPGVRDLYPAKSRRGVGTGPGRRGQLPASPTDTAPGSEAKIRVMTERAARGEALFHPLDAIGPALADAFEFDAHDEAA